MRFILVTLFEHPVSILNPPNSGVRRLEDLVSDGVDTESRDLELEGDLSEFSWNSMDG